MKKIIAWMMAAMMLSATGFAQQHHHHYKKARKKIVKVEVAPNAVQDAFKQGFANAGDVKWQKTPGGNWDAAFMEDSLQTNAIYTESGSLITTHTDYTAQNLPQVISDAVKVKYPDATIKEGTKIQPQDVAAYYKISVSDAGATRDVLVNEAGTTVTE